MARRLTPFDKNGRERATLAEKEMQTQNTNYRSFCEVAYGE
ncbi:MAG: hypothetical protein ACL7AY_15425 [Candidatus Arsenophonus phytopathogenicus]